MIIINLALLVLSLIILIKSSSYAIRYSSRLARILRFQEFIVSFFIIALISVLPEATISIISAFNGEPELGLGTLLGSNVVDLTLVFAIVVLISSKGIKVKSKIISNNFFYLILLLFPLLLGFDGRLSRIDGLILIILGILFFIRIYTESNKFRKKFNNTKREPFSKSLIFLIFSLIIILISAFLTVKYAVNFANEIKIPAVLIGITIIAIGTCLPELIFSIKAVRKNHDELAIGDILGTVITDATIILGLIAIISPFNYNPNNILITGTAMFLAGVIVTVFMKSGKEISKIEGIILLFFYLLFVFVEFLINHVTGLY